MNQRLTREAKWPKKATTDFPLTLELIEKQKKHFKQYIFQPASDDYHISTEMSKLHKSWTHIIEQLNNGKLVDLSH